MMGGQTWQEVGLDRKSNTSRSSPGRLDPVKSHLVHCLVRTAHHSEALDYRRPAVLAEMKEQMPGHLRLEPWRTRIADYNSIRVAAAVALVASLNKAGRKIPVDEDKRWVGMAPHG